MVRISAKTQYNLMRAVERYSNYYKNTTHTYFFKEIYRDTDNTFVFHVTRISNKDLGRLVEPETVGYIKLYLDNKTKRLNFSDKQAETGDPLSRHWKDSYLQSDDGKLTSHAVSLHYLKKERKQKWKR